MLGPLRQLVTRLTHTIGTTGVGVKVLVETFLGRGVLVLVGTFVGRGVLVMIRLIALLWVLVAVGIIARRDAIPAVLVSFRSTSAGVVHSQHIIANVSRVIAEVATMRVFIDLPKCCKTGSSFTVIIARPRARYKCLPGTKS